jgi:hypothetical protein
MAIKVISFRRAVLSSVFADGASLSTNHDGAQARVGACLYCPRLLFFGSQCLPAFELARRKAACTALLKGWSTSRLAGQCWLR